MVLKALDKSKNMILAVWHSLSKYGKLGPGGEGRVQSPQTTEVNRRWSCAYCIWGCRKSRTITSLPGR